MTYLYKCLSLPYKHLGAILERIPRQDIINTKPKRNFDSCEQCFGSGSGWIRIIWPDPDPLQETLIWIRVVKKNRDKLAYK